jgi:hypothetical protein
MFEALRRLRDAVAPESGNLGGNQHKEGGEEQQQQQQSSSSDQPDFEEFCQNYQSGDPVTVALVHKVNGGKPPKPDDFGRIHLLVEMEKDRELVRELATTILEKSADIDERVSNLPGMHRTKTEQMERIETLLESNRQVAEELETAYKTAEQRREQVRTFVKENACSALGIVEDSEL